MKTEKQSQDIHGIICPVRKKATRNMVHKYLNAFALHGQNMLNGSIGLKFTKLKKVDKVFNFKT